VSLTLGTRLGPYDLIAQIGVGGMGEDYYTCSRSAGILDGSS
jgi:hypothetical protein